MENPNPLPPVEPPSAAFIVQLFVVPGVIVAIIVLMWLGFNWLASSPTDPSALVKAMRRDTPHRWQSAVTLADMLRDPRNDKARNDPALARELADLLRSETQSGATGESDLQLRYYLCQALGKFDIPDGVPALVEAARASESDKEAVVSDGALEALATLAGRLKGGLTDRDAIELLLAKSHDPRPETRYRAAFALGQVGSDEALDRVEAMLADASPHVRFNAATGLAAQGRTTAVDTLVEMLDPDELTAALSNEPEASRDAQRAMIVRNALVATSALAQKSPQANLGPLREALERLLASDAPGGWRADARQLLNQMNRQATPPAKAA